MNSLTIQSLSVEEEIKNPEIQKLLPKLKDLCYEIWKKTYKDINTKEKKLSSLKFDLAVTVEEPFELQGIQYPFALIKGSKNLYDYKIYDPVQKKFVEKIEELNPKLHSIINKTIEVNTHSSMMFFEITLTENILGLSIHKKVQKTGSVYWKMKEWNKTIQNYIPLSYNPEIKESKLQNSFSYGIGYNPVFNTLENIKIINTYLKSLPDNSSTMIYTTKKNFEKFSSHQKIDFRYKQPKRKDFNFSIWFYMLRELLQVSHDNTEYDPDLEMYFYITKYKENVVFSLKYKADEDKIIEEPSYHFNIT